MAFNLWKSLCYYFDNSTLAMTLGFTGNTVPISTVDVVPFGTPPGNSGIQFYVDPVTHVVTIYVWDGSTWKSK